MTPYYQHGGITLYHGDCSEVAPGLPPIKLLLTDPPYGIAWDTDYSRFSGGITNEWRTAKPRVRGDAQSFDPTPWLGFQRVILWGANCYSNRLPMGTWLVWDKRHHTGMALLADAEVAWMNTGHGVYIFDKPWQGFLRSEKTFHPTQKPCVLMEWCIRRANTPGLILDPFAGSGTTLVAAANMGREAIGIEIDERHCETAALRLQQTILFPLRETADRAAN